jgi:hypothetical protein
MDKETKRYSWMLWEWSRGLVNFDLEYSAVVGVNIEIRD